MNRDGDGTSVQNEIDGGTFHGPVVMAGRVDRLVLHVAAPLRIVGCGLLAVLGLVCLLYAPDPPAMRRLGIGPVPAGTALLGLAAGLYVVLRAREAAVRRREAAWLSERNLARAADALARDLALLYSQDERLTQVNDPHPLDVDWTPVHGGGPEPGPDRRPSVAAYFTRLPTRRLVVLGGAGAGKSILALRLAEELVRTRPSGSAAPVAVVVPLASWDPRQGLIGWVAAQIAAAHPRACTPVRGAPAIEVARRLIETRRVLPVLDGFDELPAELRADAFEQLRASTAGRRPFVLTSREPEYREHVPDGSVFDRTEMTLRPLSTLALDRYLNPAGSPEAKWAPILRRLTNPGDEAPEVRRLREVLRVPLMAGLAREAYGVPGTDPEELLEQGEFGSRRDIERHLLDAFLSVAYSTSHDVRDRHGSWDPESARAWLGFLAMRMKAAGEHEFAWWRLVEDVPRLLRTVTLLPAFALCCLAVSQGEYGTPWWDRWVGLSHTGGYAVLALVLLVVVHVFRLLPHDGPRQLVRPTGWEVREVLGRRGNQVLAVLALGGASALWWLTWTRGTTGNRQLLALVTVVALWERCRWALKPLWRPVDPSVATSPSALLRTDRRATIGFGWLAYSRDGDGFQPYEALALFAPALLLIWQTRGGQDVLWFDNWARTLALAYLGCVLGSAAGSAWAGFALARGYVAVKGDLPRRLMAFLDDAHRRGVLRQSGGVYRFRHVELRDRLAAHATADLVRAQPVARAGGTGRMRRLARTATALVVVMLLAVGGSVACGPWVMAALPGPRTAVPAACDLLAPDLPRITVDGRFRAPERQTCLAGEQSPFAPDVQVRVSSVLHTRKDALSGSQRAMIGFGQQVARVKGDHIGAQEALPAREAGLGDQSLRMVWRLTKPPSSMEVAPYSAAFVVRVDNVLLAVTYSEEFAVRDRTVEIARILIRDALRRAGLSDAVPATGERSLADVPRTRVPETGNRFAGYARDQDRSLHGAVWEAGERSHLWYLPYTYFVFRAPKHLQCTRQEQTEKDPVGYTCRSVPEFERSGWVPKSTVEIRSWYCGSSCDSRETRDFLDRVPDHDSTKWREFRKDFAYYATVSVADGTRYRMTMKGTWGFRDPAKGENHAFLLWAQAEVPHDDAALAQKIVNDVYAQSARYEAKD
ncbi:NACHT domain-containing protein [Streptomyces sp. NPDC048737]|uniref:NACHT domain-containing protein n=1 Tax=unclassified Streptomyces TaxID=2593676 RepID=UPI00341FB943